MNTLATILVLVATGICTFLAFQKRDLWERWMFKPEEILRYKQYERMFTSALIHGGWVHFAFNAITLWCFGSSIELVYGPLTFLGIYLGSILGGSLLSLFIHRHESSYRALGASGGVCGILFASIFLLPGGSISVMFLPAIPKWLYAILYLLVTFYGLRERLGNIGHDAHLGGAIVGLLLATALYPRSILAQPVLFAVVLALSVGMLVLIGLDPLQLLRFRFRGKSSSSEFIGDERERRYFENRKRNEKLAEVDRLLDRVSQNGIHSLSPYERERLAALSKEIGR